MSLKFKDNNINYLHVQEMSKQISLISVRFVDF